MPLRILLKNTKIIHKQRCGLIFLDQNTEFSNIFQLLFFVVRCVCGKQNCLNLGANLSKKNTVFPAFPVVSFDATSSGTEKCCVFTIHLTSLLINEMESVFFPDLGLKICLSLGISYHLQSFQTASFT